MFGLSTELMTKGKLAANLPLVIDSVSDDKAKHLFLLLTNAAPQFLLKVAPYPGI